MIRVLLADDDAAVRDAVKDLLENDPRICVATVCADGFEARRSDALGLYDVAVLDVRMPGGGGDLVAEIAARGIEVVCFSADSCQQDEMLAAGAREFLVKGDRQSDLCAAVKRVASVLDEVATTC